MLIETLKRHWWVPVIRGVAAIIFGIVAFVYPGLTIAVLVLLFGAWVLVDGVFRVIGAIGHRASDPDWGFHLIIGILGIIIGFLASAFDADPVISSKGLHGSSLASGGTTLLAASSFLIRESLRRSDFLRDQNAVTVVLLKENAAWCDGFGDYSTAQEMNRLVFR